MRIHSELFNFSEKKEEKDIFPVFPSKVYVSLKCWIRFEAQYFFLQEQTRIRRHIALVVAIIQLLFFIDKKITIIMHGTLYTRN